MTDEPKWSDTRHGVGPIPTPRTLVTPSPDARDLATEIVPGLRIGKYELIREIGRGGMGTVYVGRDTRLGRLVAIKFLQSGSRVVGERFLAEARATAKCNHDNIVIIHEADEFNGIPFMVLELLVGQSLRELLAEGNKLPATRVVDLMLPVARALSRAHELGIVHRDLKPENIFVTATGQVKVLDFGIAKAVGSAGRGGRPDAHSGGDLSLTHEGALVGTLPYIAPEQVLRGEVDHRADLWACGIILFELLAGRHPVAPLTPDNVFETLLADAPMPSIRSVVPALPPELAEIVDGCLQKTPEARIATAGELAARLELHLPIRLRTGGLDNPYPGLVPFQEADAERFFGRTRDVARVVSRLRDVPLIAMVGPSGVGKSSLVRAGLVPALKASGEHWELVALRPGRNPMMALTGIVHELEQHVPVTTSSRIRHETSSAAATLQRLYREPGYLGSLLRRHARQLGGRVLLFVDQLEEVYTLCADPDERETFTRVLAAVADDPGSPLRVVVTMRSDLLDRLAETPRFMDDVTAGLVLLVPPDLDGLREALVAPVELAGHRFESPEMVDEMLAALVGAPGALPLLQFAGAKLWEARDREQRMLTHASYRAIGGIGGALASHADDVIASLDASSRQVARTVLRRLVTPERTRAILEVAELDPTSRGVVDRLVTARLLVVQTHVDAGNTIELVHESLIECWPSLRRWLDEDQDDAAFASQIAAAAKQWDARGRPAGLLWRGDAMREAARWASARPRTLPARDQAFLDAVSAYDRRGRRRRRIALVGTFAVLAAIATGASVALAIVREANARAEAESAGKREAERQRIRGELEREAAETARTQAANERDVAQGQVETKQHELERKNAELEQALDRARDEKARAEHASSDAKRAAEEANQARERLAAALAAEKARVKKLEDEKRKISTHLKD